MERINDFKFTLNVTRESYENKQDALACLSTAGAKAIGRNKMAFEEKTVTVDEFLNLAISGYAFCNRYQFDTTKKYWIENKKHQKYLMYPTYQRGVNNGAMKVCFKRDEFFRSAQVIFVDVDFTNYQTVQDYIDSLKFKPTCVYMSFSDNKEKHGITSRRFHLVYIFSDELNKEQFINAANALTKTIIEDTKEEMDDDCGTRLSQYMNGCFGNSEVYNTNIIYCYNDIINIYNNIEEDNVEDTLNKSTTYYHQCQNKDTKENESEETINEEIPTESIDNTLKCSERLISDMERLDYDEFMKYNRHKFPWIYRMEKDEWIDNTYQFCSEDYFSLYYNVHTVRDGQKRRKKLFERMCLRRVLCPTVNADTLLFNAYEDVHRFFEVDKDLTIECLVKNVEVAMSLSLDDIKLNYSNNIAYLQSKRPRSGIILRKGVASNVADRNKYLKNLRWSLIADYYDSNLSIQENLNIINENLFEVSERTLYRFCKENNIKTTKNTLTDDELLKILDINLSVRKNLEILKNSDIKVSKDRINKLLNKLKDNNNTIDTTTYYYQCQNKDSIDLIDIEYNNDWKNIFELHNIIPTFTKSTDSYSNNDEDLQVTFNLYSNKVQFVDGKIILEKVNNNCVIF